MFTCNQVTQPKAALRNRNLRRNLKCGKEGVMVVTVGQTDFHFQEQTNKKKELNQWVQEPTLHWLEREWIKNSPSEYSLCNRHCKVKFSSWCSQLIILWGVILPIFQTEMMSLSHFPKLNQGVSNGNWFWIMFCLQMMTLICYNPIKNKSLKLKK